jgi:hypothetical protein
MKVSFHLRKDKVNKEGFMPVRMLITAKDCKIFKVIKGVNGKETHWDKRGERLNTPRKNDGYNYYIEYNKIIDETEEKVKKLFRFMLLNNINQSKEYISEKLKNGLDKINLTHEFFKSFEEFKDISKSTKVARTIKSYVTTINFLKDFEASTGFKLTFESIDKTFF